jgi:hypothetical protein
VVQLRADRVRARRPPPGRQGARLDGKTIGQIRAARPDVRILAVAQPDAGYSAFPPLDMMLGPGNLILLLGPAGAVQDAVG